MLTFKILFYATILYLAVIQTPAATMSQYFCYPSKYAADDFHFPDSISIDSVYTLTGIHTRLCAINLKKWPYQSNSYLVYAEDTTNAYAFLMIKTGKTMKLQSRFKQARSGDYQFSNFDFAKYQISKNSIGIGLRFNEFVSCPNLNGGYQEQKLLLLEPQGDTLREVLFTTMNYETNITSPAMDDGSRLHEMKSQTGILIIGKPDNTSYNRLIKKVTGEFTDYDGNVSKLEGKSEVYTWDVDHYVSVDSAFDECSEE